MKQNRFSIERLAADTLQLSGTAVKIWLLGARLCNRHQYQALQEFSLNSLLS